MGNLLTELSLTVRLPGTDVKAEQYYIDHYSGCRTNVYQMYVVTNLLTELTEQWWVHMLTPLTIVGTYADRANRAGGESADRAEYNRATSWQSCQG